MATQEELAQALGPAFGVYPQAFRGNYGNAEDAANLPVDVLRGRTAGLLGMFGDVVNQPIAFPPARAAQLAIQGLSGQEQYKYPDTESMLKALPFAPTSRAGEVAGQAASFVPLNPAPAVRAVGAAGRALGPTAADMAESYLSRSGMMPSVVERTPGNVSLQNFDPKKMSKQYPDTLPGVPMVDKNTGKPYIGKVLSPEAEAVQKFKQAAQKDIEKGNYSPYFDVAQRTYADPSRYSLLGNTLTDAIAKKPETIAKWEAQLDTPEGRARLLDAYTKGKADSLTKDWYAMGQLENEFIKEFGLDKGPQMFKERFADAMAATTGGADPTANLLTATYANYMRQGKKSLPENTYDLPFPIGGRFIGGNIKMYDKAINQGAGLSASEQPKRFNFSGNFLGFKKKATIDEQMSQGFQPGLMAPPQGSYGVMENVIGDLAKSQGVDPVNFQDVTWAGLKNVAGKPMIQHVNEAIERTARITGKTPKQVVRDSLVKGTSPLYGAAPVAMMNNQPEDN
jgi:hypothetical protein